MFDHEFIKTGVMLGGCPLTVVGRELPYFSNPARLSRFFFTLI